MIRTRWALAGILAVALCTDAADADRPGVAERRAQVGYVLRDRGSRNGTHSYSSDNSLTQPAGIRPR